MYQLYGFPVSRAVAVQMVLEEGDLAYAYHHCDPREGDAARQSLLSVNAAGFVPVLVTPDGEVLHETAAIMVFLAETHNLTQLMPMPGDPLRARFFCKLFFQTSDIQPPMKRSFYAYRYSTDVQDTPRVHARATQMARERWGVLDAYLADNGPYHLGERFSLLDLHMAVWANYGLETPTAITDEFPAVAKVYQRVIERPRSGALLVEIRDMLGRQHATAASQI